MDRAWQKSCLLGSGADEACHDRELSNRQATKKKKRVGRPVWLLWGDKFQLQLAWMASDFSNFNSPLALKVSKTTKNLWFTLIMKRPRYYSKKWLILRWQFLAYLKSVEHFLSKKLITWSNLVANRFNDVTIPPFGPSLYCFMTSL